MRIQAHGSLVVLLDAIVLVMSLTPTVRKIQLPSAFVEAKDLD
jgi:hypothetical protein